MITLTLFWMLLSQDADKKPARANNLIEWWTQERVLKALDLPKTTETMLVNDLKKLQYDYQAHQTKMIQGRRVLNMMMLDPSVSMETVREHYENQVRDPLHLSHAVNIQARFLVREQLSKDHFSILAKRFPRFFSAKWFRQSRLPVFKGTVTKKKKKKRP